jgi:hypothetical protein
MGVKRPKREADHYIHTAIRSIRHQSVSPSPLQVFKCLLSATVIAIHVACLCFSDTKRQIAVTVGFDDDV